MSDKKTSTQDVIDAFAKAVGKNPEQFGTQEFENVDGEQSLVIVDNQSGSICLQANGDNGAKRLLDAIAEGRLAFVDPAKQPKSNPPTGREQGPGYGGADVSTTGASVSKDLDGTASQFKTGDEVWADLPRNDNGQVVIDNNNNIVGAKESPLAGRSPEPSNDRPAKVAAKADDTSTTTTSTGTSTTSTTSR